MHDQCMNKHSWEKVYKIHNQLLKHDKHEKLWLSLKFGTHWSPKQQQNAIWAFYQTHRVHTLHIYVKQCMNI